MPDANTSVQQLLHIPIALGEDEIEPNCIANDFDWEVVTRVYA